VVRLPTSSSRRGQSFDGVEAGRELLYGCEPLLTDHRHRSAVTSRASRLARRWLNGCNMPDGIRIIDGDWEHLPRVAVARAVRMLTRGISLVETSDLVHPAKEVLAAGQALAIGAMVASRMDLQRYFDELVNLGLMGHGNPVRGHDLLMQGMHSLAGCVDVAFETLALTDIYRDAPEKVGLINRIRQIVEQANAAERSGIKALDVSLSGWDDKKKVKSALAAERDALQNYIRKDIARLGKTEERDEFGLGPSIDPGPLGPLGALWPEGAPSSFEEHAMAGPVVVDAHGSLRADADVVTLYEPHGDPETFLKRALEFTTNVLNVAPSGKFPPTPCVYVPANFAGDARARIMGELVSGGAIPLDDDDLNVAPPRSPAEFAHAVASLHEGLGQGVSRPFQDWVAFGPTTLPDLPPLSDERWAEVAVTSASDALMRRAAAQTGDGWPTAD
jgi:hypothetical protein